jgi:plastocyanin
VRRAAGLALLLLLVPGGAAASRSTAVGVGEREYRVYPYRAAVGPGTVRFNITNMGQDAHNLQVRGPHGYRSKTTPDIRSGRGFTLTVHLRRPGVYTLICTKPGHAAKGMKAAIRVR